jgi:predicted RNase H-like nuclease (RuvC/YqgF family)
MADLPRHVRREARRARNLLSQITGTYTGYKDARIWLNDFATKLQAFKPIEVKINECQDTLARLKAEMTALERWIEDQRFILPTFQSAHDASTQQSRATRIEAAITDAEARLVEFRTHYARKKAECEQLETENLDPRPQKAHLLQQYPILNLGHITPDISVDALKTRLECEKTRFNLNTVVLNEVFTLVKKSTENIIKSRAMPDTKKRAAMWTEIYKINRNAAKVAFKFSVDIPKFSDYASENFTRCS